MGITLDGIIYMLEKEIEFDYECGSAYVIKHHVPFVRFIISELKEKQKIDKYLNQCSVYKAYQDNIRKAGSLLNEIEKSENLYDIAVNACETISVMTGDESFAERQKRKIQERRLK